jgi:hypothetical protein
MGWQAAAGTAAAFCDQDREILVGPRRWVQGRWMAGLESQRLHHVRVHDVALVDG